MTSSPSFPQSPPGPAARGALLCARCHAHQVMHHAGDGGLCCGCNVLGGGAPADWHTVCMETQAGVVTRLNRHARGNDA